jgi:hypothetical protein
LRHEPFVPFDIMAGGERFIYSRFSDIVGRFDFITPRVLALGPLSIAAACEAISTSGHGAIDPVEGAVWRVERKGRVDFLAKYVRPEKKDGCYLPELNGGVEVWNWSPPHPLGGESE